MFAYFSAFRKKTILHSKKLLLTIGTEISLSLPAVKKRNKNRSWKAKVYRDRGEFLAATGAKY